MREPWNFAELQLSCISIFQVLTCTRHYKDHHPPAKANGGKEWEGEIGALKVLSEVECNSPQNNTTKVTLQKVYILDIKKSNVGYILWAISTWQNLVGYWRRVKIR